MLLELWVIKVWKKINLYTHIEMYFKIVKWITPRCELIICILIVGFLGGDENPCGWRKANLVGCSDPKRPENWCSHDQVCCTCAPCKRYDNCVARNKCHRPVDPKCFRNGTEGIVADHDDIWLPYMFTCINFNHARQLPICFIFWFSAHH